MVTDALQPAGHRPMRILLTNNTLAGRAGSELYVLDLARALVARGHNPVAYSTILGEVAEELRRATVPVVSDLNDLTEPPGVIHGQHHLDAMTAMAHFPTTPAIYMCHGFMPWQEAPPKYPTIARYIAVDDLVRERLISNGIDPQRCLTIRNFVDLDRFPPKAALAPSPRRAAIFSNYLSDEDPQVAAIRAGCHAAGVTEVVLIGRRAGTATSDPGVTLAQFDVVFGKARAILEALAVGTAAVVADALGMGGLVTPANFDRLRRLNFGVRTMQGGPPTEASVRTAVSGYDPHDIQTLRGIVRAQASLDSVADQWVTLYQEVIAEATGNPDLQHAVAAADERQRATAAYLAGLAVLVKDGDQARHAAQRYEDYSQLLAQQLQVVEAAYTAVEGQLRAAQAAQLQATSQAERTNAALVAAEAARARAEMELHATQQELAEASGVVAALTGSRAWQAAERYRAGRARLRRVRGLPRSPSRNLNQR